MPVLWLPEAELKALQAVFLSLTQRPDPVPVDWEAYERAKQYVVMPVRPPVEGPTAAP